MVNLATLWPLPLALGAVLIGSAEPGSARVREELISNQGPTALAESFCGRAQHLGLDSLPPRGRDALRRCGRPRDAAAQAACQMLSGFQLIGRGNERRGSELIREARDRFASRGDDWGVWTGSFLLAEIAHAAGRGEEARSLLAQATGALDHFDTARTPLPSRSGRLFLEISGIPDSPIEQARAARIPARDLLLRTALNSTRALLAYSSGCDGRHREAAAEARRVLALHAAGVNLLEVSRLHEFLGWLDEERGTYEDAIADYETAFEQSLSRHPRRIISVATRLSHRYSVAGRPANALAVLTRAVERTGSDTSAHAQLLMAKSLVHARAGDSQASRAALRRARAAARSVSQLRLEESILVLAGAQLIQMGLLQQAAATLEEAVELLERSRDHASQRLLAQARLALMQAYGPLGLRSNVEFQLAEIRKLADSGGGGRDILAMAEAASWDHRKPRRVPESSAVEREEREDLGALASRHPEFASQLRDMDDLIARLETVETPEEMASIVAESAIAARHPELRALFRAIAEKRFELVREWADREAETAGNEASPLAPWKGAEDLARAALIEALLGDPAEAANRARRAVSMMEGFLDRMDLDEMASAMVHWEGRKVYSTAVFALSLVDVEEAFIYAERGRGRALRLALDERPALSPHRNAEQTRVLEEIARRENDLLDAEALDGSELERLRDEYRRLRLEERLSAGPKTDRTPRPPPTIESLQRDILDANTSLVTYYTAEDQLLIWVVTPTTIEMTTQPMPADDLAGELASLRQTGGPCAGTREQERGVVPDQECPAHETSERLYSALIAPIESWLQGRHLIIVPTGLLYAIPFAALRSPSSGRYLVEDYSLSMAPAVSALVPPASDPGELPRGVLVMGDSLTPRTRLGGARREVLQVAELLRDKPFLEAEASESRVYESASQTRLLHFATHGEYLPRRPYFSRLLLSPDQANDGILHVHEILDRLDLRGVDLVVLSGCETALGEVTRGDDVVSLTRAFLLAGSRAVVSTLWRVNDEASAELMVGFYRRLLTDGDSPLAEALRGAQLEVLARPETSVPYYWAGYSLTGRLSPTVKLLAKD